MKVLIGLRIVGVKAMWQAKLTIGIAGAGIGGLTAAALLAEQGHAITVFDQFDTPEPVGSGLVIQPVGMRVLDRIGAGDQARDLGNAIHRMLGEETDRGRRVLDVSYGSQSGLGIHRASLFQSLMETIITFGSIRTTTPI